MCQPGEFGDWVWFERGGDKLDEFDEPGLDDRGKGGELGQEGADDAWSVGCFVGRRVDGKDGEDEVEEFDADVGRVACEEKGGEGVECSRVSHDLCGRGVWGGWGGGPGGGWGGGGVGVEEVDDDADEFVEFCGFGGGGGG